MSEAELPVFVYGTLRPGQVNYPLIEKYAISQKTGLLEKTCLFSFGSYPMAVSMGDLPDNLQWSELTTACVHGHLITIDPRFYQAVITDLDYLEDYFPQEKSMYYRVVRKITTSDQADIDAWVYLGNPVFLSPEYPLIPGGDWVTYCLD